MSDTNKPPPLPDLTEVMSSYWEDDWEPTPTAVDKVRESLRAWLTDGEKLEHGVLCVVTAAQTYMNTRATLSNESRSAIAEWYAAELARFERLSDDLLSVKNLAFGMPNPAMADRSFKHLINQHPDFFFNILGEDTFRTEDGSDGDATVFISAIDLIRRWVGQRTATLRASCDSMSEPGQKEATAERVLGVTVGREWKHLREGYGLTATRPAFFTAARNLLIESGVDVPAQVPQLVKAYENHA